MPQTNLNKRLYEAIRRDVGITISKAAASACEKIVLQEKIDLLNYILEDEPYPHEIKNKRDFFTEQLNNLP